MVRKFLKRIFHIQREGIYYTYQLGTGRKRRRKMSKRLFCEHAIASNGAIEARINQLSSSHKNMAVKLAKIDKDIAEVDLSLWNSLDECLKEQANAMVQARKVIALQDACAKELDNLSRRLQAISQMGDDVIGLQAEFNNREQSVLALAEAHIKEANDKLDRVVSSQTNIERMTRAGFDRTALMQSISQHPSIMHFSAFVASGNIGDRILVHALRDTITKTLGTRIFFAHRSVRAKISPDIIQVANAADAVLIGGGGLFLRDTNENDISGWQFPISLNDIERLHVPIVMLGVGYNRFRRQDDFDPAFTENINSLVSKCKFVGLRNHGSIRALRSYLSEANASKLVFHPCATTVLSKLYRMPAVDSERPIIALNCAFDRANMRYPNGQDNVLGAIARLMKRLSSAYTIKYYSHMDSDMEMLPYLTAEDVEFEIVDLSRVESIDMILSYYCTPSIVIGMRGHSQLVPFGCGTPIMSIISHDKLAWFLEDIGHPEWGVDVEDEQFESLLNERADNILSKLDETRRQIESLQTAFWELTQENIRTAFSGVSIFGNGGKIS